MLPYRSAPGIPCVRFALRKGRGCLNRGLGLLRGWAVMARHFAPMVVCIGDCACCLNRGLGLFSLMGCDGPPHCPVGVCIGDCACCLNRGLRRFSQMGCDAPRRFVPVGVCIGDCACCLNRGLRGFSQMGRMQRHFAPLSSSSRVQARSRFWVSPIEGVGMGCCSTAICTPMIAPGCRTLGSSSRKKPMEPTRLPSTKQPRRNESVEPGVSGSRRAKASRGRSCVCS